MSRNIEQLRNIGVIAHIDAGKTTVTERMLFYSGAKHRVGMVDKGTTETDSDPEEQERGITIYSACVTFRWNNVDINLLDTPGHVDFTAEVERCLRVLDGAAVVFSAREGVEAQSETVWRQADRYSVPRVAFINKMDREGADFNNVIEQMRERLSANPVIIQLPLGAGPSHVDNHFRGVIDLISMKLRTYDADSEGAEYTESDIPDEQLDMARIWREGMLEQLYEYSDEMMELALSEAEIPASLVRKVLRAATIQQLVQPVLCGSALHGIGVQPVLDAVESYLPNPVERPPVEGKAVATGRKSASDEVITRKPDVSEPFCALVFKVLPAKTGDIAWARVYSGQLKANSRVYNPGKDKKDNVAQLWQIRAQAKDRDGQIDEVSTGDIVCIIGLRHSITGDTLCDAAAPLLLETIEFPDTVISMAIEPENATERDKLADTLEMLQRQDPTLEIIEGDTGQTLMRGMGELHLEVVKNRLLREFKLNVKFHQPQVSYRETINSGVTVVGECNRLINGVQKFAKITMLVEPDENVATGCAVRSQLEPGALTGELLEVMFDELNSCGSSGGNIAGFPLMGIRATVKGVETMEEVTDDMAIRIAINDAFDKGLTQGNPVLLEPIMKLSVSTPEQYLGDFVGDLQQRRGIIVHTENHGDRTDILANAPLNELFGYSSAMRSLSQGRASCSMEPLEYAAAPPEHAKEFTF